MPSSVRKLSVSPEGIITAIYSDELVGLNRLGEVSIERASNVEPVTLGPARAGWQAVMVDGTMLPACETREQALALEVAYLEHKLFSY